MFLKQWEEDQAEGKTVRALHERLSEHIEDDDARHEKLQGEIQSLREDRAFNAGRSGGDFGAGGTGRFPALPPAGTPQPFQPPPLVAVTVDAPAREKRRTSLPPALTKALSSTAAKVAFLVLAACAGWLLRHIGVAPAEAAKVEHVEH